MLPPGRNGPQSPGRSSSLPSSNSTLPGSWLHRSLSSTRSSHLIVRGRALRRVGEPSGAVHAAPAGGAISLSHRGKKSPIESASPGGFCGELNWIRHASTANVEYHLGVIAFDKGRFERGRAGSPGRWRPAMAEKTRSAASSGPRPPRHATGSRLTPPAPIRRMKGCHPPLPGRAQRRCSLSRPRT
jgi:hypothetical protein